MAVNLIDIRTAVQNYLNTSVSVSISALVPDVPSTINRNEEFTFSVTATNAPAPNGISLVNVRYHVRVANSSVAKLIVPATVTARSGASATSTLLVAGALVSQMFLFPADNSLTVGDSDTVAGLKGKAGGAVGTTQILFDIFADPDLDFLFPKNENSPITVTNVNVV